MGNIKVNYAALKRFKENLDNLNKGQKAEFTDAALNELAVRLWTKVKKRTPVGNYRVAYQHVLKSGKRKGQTVTRHNNPSGKTGGTLRRNWTIGNVIRNDDGHSIEVRNPIEYAPYVEFGHRGVYVPALGKTLHLNTRFTSGKFMLTISEQELKADAPRILKNKLNQFLKGTFHVK